MSKVTTPANAVDIQRAKWAQQLTNKVTLHRRNLSIDRFTPTDAVLLIFKLRVLCLNSIYTQTWQLRRGLTILQKLTHQPWDSQEK